MSECKVCGKLQPSGICIICQTDIANAFSLDYTQVYRVIDDLGLNTIKKIISKHYDDKETKYQKMLDAYREEGSDD